ncbi:15407_t:CDS:1, partial [Racocetra fulgida]
FKNTSPGSFVLENDSILEMQSKSVLNKPSSSEFVANKLVDDELIEDESVGTKVAECEYINDEFAEDEPLEIS